MKKTRNYGIDLLRLVLMFMVCLLHILQQGGALNNCVAGTAHHRVFLLLECFTYCAVDSFAFISGYMATNKPARYEKLVRMWFQVFFYSFILTAIFAVTGIYENWTIRDAIRCAMPVTFRKFWYFTAYFALFLAAPVLNRFLFEIDETTAKRYFVGLLVLFSAVGWVNDAFVLNGGYSALWVIALYSMGVLANRIRLFETKRSITLIGLWLGCLLFGWYLLAFVGSNRFLTYHSVPVLCCAIIMVILFSRLKLKGNILKKLSPLAFGVYLFQMNQVIWTMVLNDVAVFVASEELLVAIGCVLGLSIALFISGLIVEFVRSKIEHWLKVPQLSLIIVNIIDKCLSKVLFLVK